MAEIARAHDVETVVLLSEEARSERVFEEIRRVARRLRSAGLGAARGLGDHVQVRPGVDENREPRPDERLVIGEHDSNRHRLASTR